jgi:hypothetical protein
MGQPKNGNVLINDDAPTLSLPSLYARGQTRTCLQTGQAIGSFLPPDGLFFADTNPCPPPTSSLSEMHQSFVNFDWSILKQVVTTNGHIA